MALLPSVEQVIAVAGSFSSPEAVKILSLGDKHCHSGAAFGLRPDADHRAPASGRLPFLFLFL